MSKMYAKGFRREDVHREPPPRVKEMWQMYTEGEEKLSYAELGKRFGISKQRVHQLFSRYYHTPRESPKTQRFFSRFDDPVAAEMQASRTAVRHAAETLKRTSALTRITPAEIARRITNSGSPMFVKELFTLERDAKLSTWARIAWAMGLQLRITLENFSEVPDE